MPDPVRPKDRLQTYLLLITSRGKWSLRRLKSQKRALLLNSELSHSYAPLVFCLLLNFCFFLWFSSVIALDSPRPIVLHSLISGTHKEIVKLLLQSDENYSKVEAAISRILQRHTLEQVAMESPIGSNLLCYEYAPRRCPNSWEDINEILLIILGVHFGDLRDFLKFLGRTIHTCCGLHQ